MDNSASAKSVRRCHKVKDHTDPDWRGYSLDDLAYRRSVNQVKQQLVTERLRQAVAMMRMEHEQSASHGLFGTITSWLTYADYGVAGFRLFKRLRNLYRGFKS